MYVRIKRFIALPAVWLGVLAALLYNSWPLAFLLNPAVGKHALASQLEAPHQPYDWLFVALDVLTGVVIAGVALLQLRVRKHTTLLIAAVVCYVIFGVFVAGAALIPLSCDPQVDACGPLLRNPSIVAHGFMSIASVISLLVGLVLVAQAMYVARAARILQLLFAATMACWLGFGIGSLAELWLHVRGNNLLQDFFITVCSISVALVVAGIEYLLTHNRQTVPEAQTARVPSVYNRTKE
ncbi:MAG TPA: DUF998 domain-containing protein [Patescibacteria group bacterium]|nr:DUF998 domain-containing protein [Patescibacteria group bacterium]